MAEQQKMRVDAIRATDCAVVTDQNGVVLIFSRPVYSPGALNDQAEMVPSASVYVPWNLAVEVARIINAKHEAQRAASAASASDANGKALTH